MTFIASTIASFRGSKRTDFKRIVTWYEGIFNISVERLLHARDWGWSLYKWSQSIDFVAKVFS